MDEKFGDITNNYVDSCKTRYPVSIKIGGGEIWQEVFAKVGSQYNVSQASQALTQFLQLDDSATIALFTVNIGSRLIPRKWLQTIPREQPIS